MTIRLPAAVAKDLGLKAKAAPVAEAVVADVKPAAPAAPEVRVVEVRVAEGLADAVDALRTAVDKMQPPAPPKRPTGMEMVPKRNDRGQITSVAITFNWS